MLSEIKNRYAQSLKRSESFLDSKKTTAKSTSINSTRELCLLRNQAECPICATKFVGKNHNTEHIHPRSLGGLDNDENKIQMCTACNNSRNLTMQSMLGNPPYYKNYLKIKSDVDEFILWSELTADDGLQAGSVFPRAQEIFTETRFANNKPPVPQRSYGRFSTWNKDSFPNLNLNKTPISPIEQNQGKRKIGFIERFFDKLFGYEPKKPETQNEKLIFDLNGWLKDNWNGLEDAKESYLALKASIAKHEKNNLGRPVRQTLETDFGLKKNLTLDAMYNKLNDLYQQKIDSTKSTDEGEGVDSRNSPNSSDNLLGNDEFVEVITSLLSHNEEKTFEKLAPEFLEQMQNKGYDVKNVNQCLELFGFPKGLRKAVDANMDGFLKYDGTITSPTIKLVGTIKNGKAKGDSAISFEEKNNQLRLRNEFIEVVNEKLRAVEKLHINNLFSPWNSTSWYDSGLKGWKELKIAMGYTHSRSLTSIVEELVGDKVSIIHEGTIVYISFK